jgi:hypothetical protein
MADNQNIRSEPENKYGGMRVELSELGGEKRIEVRIWKDDGIKVLQLDKAKQLADWILELMPKPADYYCTCQVFIADPESTAKKCWGCGKPPRG